MAVWEGYSQVMPPFRRMDKEQVPTMIVELIESCNYLARQYRRKKFWERIDQGGKGIPAEHACRIFTIGRELENCLYALDPEHFRETVEFYKSLPMPSFTAYPDSVWNSDEDIEGWGDINDEWGD